MMVDDALEHHSRMRQVPFVKGKSDVHGHSLPRLATGVLPPVAPLRTTGISGYGILMMWTGER